MVMIDAISRLVPGVLNNGDSAEYESFENGMLEYPQYTRPPEFLGEERTGGAAFRSPRKDRRVEERAVLFEDKGEKAGICSIKINNSCKSSLVVILYSSCYK